MAADPPRGPLAGPAREALLRRAATALTSARRVLLACHVRPDADALGSLLGLALGLEALGKEVTALSPDGVPPLYRFLPSWERVQPSAAGSWDVAVGLDADGSDRLGPAEPLVLAQPVVINLDHHPSKPPYGHVVLVDPGAAATGELVFALLRELAAPLTPEVAACLMAALLTDTGSFRYPNVTPETFRIAAALREAGALPGIPYEAVYGTRSYAGTLLLGRLLAAARRSPCERLVWACLSAADFAAAGASTEETEGFVDQLRMVAGAEVAIFYREETGGQVRVSLRARGTADVAGVARRFGGGGHRAAAGCSLPGPLATAAARVNSAALEALAASDPALPESDPSPAS